MDHDATREQLDLAAAEPGGLERLMAGDTATAQAVAAHLAGCEDCSEELVRLQRSAALIRSAVRELPPDDLRARTLAAVRAQGVPRPLAAAARRPAPVTSRQPRPSHPRRLRPPPRPRPHRLRPSSSRREPGRRTWPALGHGRHHRRGRHPVRADHDARRRLPGGRPARRPGRDDLGARGRHRRRRWRSSAQPDAEHVTPGRRRGSGRRRQPGLLAVDHRAGGRGHGSRPPPAAGYEYRCWVSVDGLAPADRQDVLRGGPRLLGRPGAGHLGRLDGDATFGVSLVGAQARRSRPTRSSSAGSDPGPGRRRARLIGTSLGPSIAPSGGGASR